MNVLGRTGHLVQQLGGILRSELNSVCHDRQADVIPVLLIKKQIMFINNVLILTTYIYI